VRKSYDAVVVGAGIVGAACTLEFALEGMSVAVVERDAVAGGATGAAMGHVVVMDDSAAQFELTRYSQSLWHELALELPADVEYYRPGTIWVRRTAFPRSCSTQSFSPRLSQICAPPSMVVFGCPLMPS